MEMVNGLGYIVFLSTYFSFHSFFSIHINSGSAGWLDDGLRNSPRNIIRKENYNPTNLIWINNNLSFISEWIYKREVLSRSGQHIHYSRLTKPNQPEGNFEMRDFILRFIYRDLYILFRMDCDCGSGQRIPKYSIRWNPLCIVSGRNRSYISMRVSVKETI